MIADWIFLAALYAGGVLLTIGLMILLVFVVIHPFALLASLFIKADEG